jgi:hypothetical protein
MADSKHADRAIVPVRGLLDCVDLQRDRFCIKKLTAQSRRLSQKATKNGEIVA